MQREELRHCVQGMEGVWARYGGKSYNRKWGQVFLDGGKEDVSNTGRTEKGIML